jgi:Retrotransposon gag protein/Zinc knuckle
MMDEERVIALEQAQAKTAAREVELDTKLDTLLAQVALLSQQHTQSPHTQPARPIPPTEHPRSSRTARPAAPTEFSGERSEGLAFLNSCQTYIRLCSDEFPDEQTKIMWAMSYMKTGRAQKWAARIYRWEQLEENAGESKFFDWQDFRDDFRKEFTPAHIDAVAINRLESSAYYQKNRPLDDYVDEFQDLVADSGYTDPKTIVVKFRRGLNPQIQNAVATMASGRPSDEKPEQWYKMARTIDQNRAANEAFSSTQRSSVSSARPTGNSLFRMAEPQPKAVHAHIRPTPGNPVPMDLDAGRRTPASVLCFRCKKPGHFGKDCPERFDIRLMTTEELEEVLQLRMTQLDVVPTEGVDPVETAQSEDF